MARIHQQAYIQLLHISDQPGRIERLIVDDQSFVRIAREQFTAIAAHDRCGHRIARIQQYTGQFPTILCPRQNEDHSA